jgi:hypothetical protein
VTHIDKLKIREACPFVILEAAYWRIPVITTNIGGQKELSRLIGFKVDGLVGARKDKTLAEAIISCREEIASVAPLVDQKRIEALFDRLTFDRKMESVIESL